MRSTCFLSMTGTLLLPVFLLIFANGCSGRKEPPAMSPRPVQTAVALQKDVPYYIEAFGNLTALVDVDIKSQVTGKILEVHFKQGEKVSAGDPLFTIDPASYKADLDKAKASVAVAEVDLKLKKDTLERNRPLVAKALVSQQDFEKFETDADMAAAQLNLDKANLELAQINLDYCAIKSPVNGYIGKILVNAGNIVPANTGPVLANVKAIDTLYVDFTVTDKDLEKVRRAMASGTLKVEVRLPDDDKNIYNGELKVVENSIDNTTGTIFLRAIVPNQNNLLWAGQFVYIKLILGTEKNAILIPYQAVQLGQKGAVAFVIMPGNKTDLRILKTGSRQGDDIVVEDGIKAGEKVVTVGQMGLSQGALVKEVQADLQPQHSAEKL